MPAGWGEDEERFAAAVEAGPGAHLPRDGELARELEIVTMLRESRAAMSPDAATAARMRADLFARIGLDSAADTDSAPLTAVQPTVAITAAAVTEPVDTHGAPTRTRRLPRGRHRSHIPAEHGPSSPMPRPRPGRRRASGRSRKLALVGTGAMCLLIAVVAAGMLFSRGSLPGDKLYGVKRSTEAVGLALTFGREAIAQKNLDLASTRLDELEAMVKEAGAGQADPQLVDAAMAAFTQQATEGSRLTLSSAGDGPSAELGSLANWAAEQGDRVATLKDELPASAVPKADNTLGMLDRLHGRSLALQNRLQCSQVTSGSSDDLGPLPAQGRCTPRQAKSGQSALPPGTSANSDEGTATTETDPSTTTSDNGGLLPNLLPGQSSSSAARSGAPHGGGLGLPPITIPPLLPGMAPISLG